MKIEPIQTRQVKPGDTLWDLMDDLKSQDLEGCVLAVTSKIISLAQGRVISLDHISKDELIRQEADAILKNPGHLKGIEGIVLTLKNKILIPSAGIDESNGSGSYILYPNDIQREATDLWTYVRKKFQLKNFGILITDSHTTPLRRGVTGIGLGWCGFAPLHSYVGKLDLDGKPLRFTQINLIDSIATAATLAMGEGDECTPLALLSNIPKIEFQDRPPTNDELTSISIPLGEDIYSPLLNAVTWCEKF